MDDLILQEQPAIEQYPVDVQKSFSLLATDCVGADFQKSRRFDFHFPAPIAFLPDRSFGRSTADTISCGESNGELNLHGRAEMKSLFAVLLTLWASAVFARSPAGTAEYEAESKALAMMRQDFGGYLPLDAQMRSNQLSISIPATNARGKRVDFKCLVKKTPLRGGGFRFDVGRPVIAQ